METLIWHERLKGRVRNPDGVPEYRVVINGVSAEPSAIERETIQEILASMPVIEEPIMERKAYKQVDGEGLLGATTRSDCRTTSSRASLAPP